MGLWILCFMMTLSTAFAEVGRVVKISDHSDAYLVRNKSKVKLELNTSIETGDEIISENSSVILQLYPETQVNLAKQSQLKIEQADLEVNKNQEKAFSVLKLSKGMVRTIIPMVKKQVLEQRWETEGMSGMITQGEFELSLQENKNSELEVFDSQVAVSSPFIQSFVPEIVKANEGFTFNWKDKGFSRRKIAPKFTDHTSFLDVKVIKKNWEKVKKKFTKKTGNKV